MKRRIGACLSLAMIVSAVTGLSDQHCSNGSPLYVCTVPITAIVPGTDFPNNAWWQSLDRREAPQIPEEARDYDDIIKCKDEDKAVAAWTEVHTAWPDFSVMYTVNAEVRDGKVVLGLRSRQGYGRGYTYIDVIALCMVVD